MILQSIIESFFNISYLKKVELRRENEPAFVERNVEQEYISISRNVVRESLKILQSDGWKLEREAKNGDKVYCKVVPNFGTVYKVNALINAPAKYLKKELFDRIENTSDWQPRTVVAKRIKVLNKHTDITYIVNRSGTFTSDMIALRAFFHTNKLYAIAARSIDYTDSSIKRTRIRVDMKLDCWVMEENPEERNCLLQGMSAFSSNVWFPSYLTNQMVCDALLDRAKNIRLHFQNLKTHDLK